MNKAPLFITTLIAFYATTDALKGRNPPGRDSLT